MPANALEPARNPYIRIQQSWQSARRSEIGRLRPSPPQSRAHQFRLPESKARPASKLVAQACHDHVDRGLGSIGFRIGAERAAIEDVGARGSFRAQLDVGVVHAEDQRIRDGVVEAAPDRIAVLPELLLVRDQGVVVASAEVHMASGITALCVDEDAVERISDPADHGHEIPDLAGLRIAFREIRTGDRFLDSGPGPGGFDTKDELLPLRLRAELPAPGNIRVAEVEAFSACRNQIGEEATERLRDVGRRDVAVRGAEVDTGVKAGPIVNLRHRHCLRVHPRLQVSRRSGSHADADQRRNRAKFSLHFCPL